MVCDGNRLEVTLRETLVELVSGLKFCFGSGSLLTCTSLALWKFNAASGSCLIVVGGSVLSVLSLLRMCQDYVVCHHT